MAPRNQNTQVPTPGVGGETVVGLFADQAAAERGIEALKAAGYSQQQKDLTEGTGTEAAEGATKGAMGGGVLGGLVGLLAGVGALAIPGIGPIIAGGALASTLAGAGIGAAAGGLIGALVGMGLPEEDAKHFERGFQEGGVLVTVLTVGNAEEARAVILARGGDLGPGYTSGASTAAGAESWRGSERRYNDGAGYAGPERRLAAR
jgi:hypothetical protein